MKRVLNFIQESIGDAIGNPVAIRNVLTAASDISCGLDSVARTASTESVTDWSRLLGLSSSPYFESRPLLNGYATVHGLYTQSQVQVVCLSKLVQTRIIRNWHCTIGDVQGLAASKSPLNECSSLDEFATQHCTGLMTDVSDAGIGRNLAYRGVAIVNRTGDYFRISDWDGRLFLINSDGSHHFAAARAVAKALNTEIALIGDIYLRGIDRGALRELCDTYDIFALRDNVEVSGIIDAIENFKAAYYLGSAPKNYPNAQLIYLPKDDKRSQQVAATFREFKIDDMGRHLRNMLSMHSADTEHLVRGGMAFNDDEDDGLEDDHADELAPGMA